MVGMMNVVLTGMALGLVVSIPPGPNAALLAALLGAFGLFSLAAPIH